MIWLSDDVKHAASNGSDGQKYKRTKWNVVDCTASQDKRETEVQNDIDELHGNERDDIGYTTS